MKKDQAIWKGWENKMKKVYQKPQIVEEVFTLSQTLCACAIRNTNLSEHLQCNYPLEGLPGFYVFAQHWASCQGQADGPIKEQYCYQPGAGGAQNVFSS